MADPSGNPFASLTAPTGAPESQLSNPFDIFAGTTNTVNNNFAQPPGAEPPRVATPSPPSNPFDALATTPPHSNTQAGEKPANALYQDQHQQHQQQSWQIQQQPPMDNGRHAVAAQQQFPMQQQVEQPATQPSQQQYSNQQPQFSQPQTAGNASPSPGQNPFSWSPPRTSSQPVTTPSVENLWDTSSQQSAQPAATPFDSFQGAPQTNPYQQVAATNPFVTPGFPPAGAPYSGAIVPSQQASNPYAGFVVPPQIPQQSQALVPAAQPSSQWTVGGPKSAPSAAATFDPFAPAPLPAPVPPPSPVLPPAPSPFPVAQSEPLYSSHAMVPANSAGYPGAPNAFVSPTATYAGGALIPTEAAQPYAKLPPVPTENQMVAATSSQHSRNDDQSQDSTTRRTGEDVDRQMVPYKQEDHDHDAPNDRQLAVVPDDDSAKPKRNLFSEALAQNAPPGSAPLPKADLVVKAGYVLARISFRTIVMKKWKQAYWVQYGPHTMLWFRSQADFDDWLNNPYHTPTQRNFLIKLAVNFVHDLYKPNVRGYQVTQARTKAYGRDQIKQFKLERWMDYGPTIAAAFGSQDPREVDNLRQALVECMRNTPLEGGIRATGAVRQDHDERRRDSDDEEDRERDREHNYSYDTERNAGANFDEDENNERVQEKSKSSPARNDQAPSAPPPVTGDLLDFAADLPSTNQPSVPSQGPPGVAGMPNYPVQPHNYAQPIPPQGYAQPFPPQPYPQPYPPQGYAQQPPPNQQQQYPVYSQPSPQQHYFGFPPVPTQFSGQPQQQH